MLQLLLLLMFALFNIAMYLNGSGSFFFVVVAVVVFFLVNFLFYSLLILFVILVALPFIVGSSWTLCVCETLFFLSHSFGFAVFFGSLPCIPRVFFSVRFERVDDRGMWKIFVNVKMIVWMLCVDSEQHTCIWVRRLLIGVCTSAGPEILEYGSFTGANIITQSNL